MPWLNKTENNFQCMTARETLLFSKFFSSPKSKLNRDDLLTEILRPTDQTSQPRRRRIIQGKNLPSSLYLLFCNELITLIKVSWNISSAKSRFFTFFFDNGYKDRTITELQRRFIHDKFLHKIVSLYLFSIYWIINIGSGTHSPNYKYYCCNECKNRERPRAIKR